jgi:toxin CptA
VGATAQDHKYSDAEVRITLAPSRIGAAALAAMASATLALIALTPGAAALRILAATWVACAALHALHAVALHRGRHGVRALRVDREGGIDLQDGEGAWRAGLVRAGSFVAPWLAIVRWRAHGARFDASVVILPDMLPAGDFRRMRVWLRWSSRMTP